ncbi:MAG: hypothetical protein JXD21_01805 [Candidatus Omnitrophica bacterium]|nr:hypothetical protein [Candidatus Omnitrophota bacterium]
MKLETIKNAVLVWGIISHEHIACLKDEDALVIVPEQRPYCVGIHHNLPLLSSHYIPAVYCTDNMIGILFYTKKIKKTFLFCRKGSLRPEGMTGASYAALLSEIHRVPVCILAEGEYDLSGFDRDASTLAGHNFVVDERSKKYIIHSERETIGEEVPGSEV